VVDEVRIVSAGDNKTILPMAMTKSMVGWLVGEQLLLEVIIKTHYEKPF